MQVHRDINNLPLFKNAVITIGTFDGVHTGHLQIIKQLREEAKKINGESVIITFDPHPRMVISPSPSLSPVWRGEEKATGIKLLNTLEEKIELLEKQKIDHLVVVPFTKQFSEQSAEGYIKNFLVEKFWPHTVIIGHDHHFGNERKGNYKLLEAYEEEFNFQVKEIPEHVLNQVTISSTKIREALLNCDIETANKYLGYDYFFEGQVVQGKYQPNVGALHRVHIENGCFAVERDDLLAIGVNEPNLNLVTALFARMSVNTYRDEHGRMLPRHLRRGQTVEHASDTQFAVLCDGCVVCQHGEVDIHSGPLPVNGFNHIRLR